MLKVGSLRGNGCVGCVALVEGWEFEGGPVALVVLCWLKVGSLRGRSVALSWLKVGSLDIEG